MITTEKRLKTIIIGSADVIKLCVVRAVGSYGCDVDVIHLGSQKGWGIKPVDYYSKYVSNYYFTQRDGLVELLLSKCKNLDTKPVLFTLDDYSTFLIDKSREELGNYFRFAHLLNDRPIDAYMNKHLLKMKASEVGMKIAEGWPIPYEGGEFILPKGIKYPCFLKGLHSTFVSKGIQCRCNNEEELLQYLQICKRKYPHPIYAEEFLPIEKDFGVIGVSDGVYSIIPAKVELIEMGKGSTNGVSMLGKVSPIKDPILLEQIESLLKDISYTGIFNIDFVESKGQVYFVELNFRFAAYGFGVFRAGCNIPAIFINMLTNNENKSLNNQIEPSCYYLNEKIALTNLIENNIRLRKYRTLRKKADYTMVRDKKDPKPFWMFFAKMGIKYIKKKIHF